MKPKIRPLYLTLLGILAFAAPAAHGQDDENEAEKAEIAANEAVWTDENFDQWVFGNVGDAAAVRARLSSLLNLQIDDIHRVCSLTEAQKKKLQLAGRGDIKRLFDRVDEKKKKFQLVKNDQNKIGEIFQEIQPLQAEFQSGSFDESSLLFRTVNKTLDAEQGSKYAKVMKDRKLYRYRARVEMAIAMLDSVVAFRGDQRERLEAVILAETTPPRKFGTYDYYVVMNQLANIPEARIKPIFDDTQWKTLHRQLEQSKGMKQFLADSDLLDADARPAQAPPAAETKAEVKKN